MRSNNELSSPTEGRNPQSIPLLPRLDFLSAALKEQHYRDVKYITVYQLLKMNEEDEGNIPPSLNLKILPTIFFCPFLLPYAHALFLCSCPIFFMWHLLPA